jgi:hypothetical protein
MEIKINPADLAAVKRMLGGMKDAAPKVLSRALNKTLTGVKTDASTEIRAIITAPKASVDKTFRVVNATPTNLSALFESKGRPLPLIDFGARQTTKGVSVQVKRASARSVIAGAFIGTLKSGHKGVFWRQWHGDKRPKKPLAYGTLPKKFRLPIEQRFGPRIPDILSNQPVMATVLKKAEERLHKNIEHELSYELSKL